MFQVIRDVFFFPTAYYFAFFAKIKLKRWNPRVIVVTGSSGKTTLFSMIESQIKDSAHFSHHANSAIGVPFDILDLHRKTLKFNEWIGIICKAPIQAFKKSYSEDIYIVECDADRPGEGKFLAELLRPEVTLWISSSRTHSMNFDTLVPEKFPRVEDAIAYEFGYFLEHTTKQIVLNGESELEKDQIQRAKAAITEACIKDLISYKVDKNGTVFTSKNQSYVFNKLILPKEIFYSIEMTRILCDYLKIPFDPQFKNLQLPPARSSLFKGIKDITIIDSTYNANLSSMSAILNMFQSFPSNNKWGVFGDMLEQGKEEQEEHEKLADLIATLDLKRIVLLGPRVKKYTYEKLVKELNETPIDVFENPKDVLDFLKSHIKGRETILFKGARFLEGVIEHLLLDKKEKKLLARREEVWEKRRKKWGL